MTARDDERTEPLSADAFEHARGIVQARLAAIGMPKLSGYAATQRIREFDWAQNIFIVALTGWGQMRDRENSRSADCNAHLVKPVTLEELNAALADRSR